MEAGLSRLGKTACSGGDSELETLLAAADRALGLDGDLGTSRGYFERAYRLAECTGDADAMAVAALGTGGTWLDAFRSVTETTRLEERLRHVLELLEPHTLSAFRVRARLLGEADYRNGTSAAVMPLLDEIGQVSDPEVRAEVLHIVRQCLTDPDHGAVRRRISAELINESFRTRRRSDLVIGLLWRTVNSFLEGDRQAKRVLSELRAALAQRDHLAAGFVVSGIDVMLAIRAGQFDRAEELARSCATLGAGAGDIDGRVWQVGHLATIRWHQGRLGELLPVLSELIDSPVVGTPDDSLLAAYAVACASAGDTRAALSALFRLTGKGLEELPRSSSWLVTLYAVVEAAHLLKDPETSRRAYDLLAPYEHLPIMGGLGVACFGSVQHALGVAAATTGDLDRAVTHLRTAVQRNLALAHWPAVVASRRRLAEVLALRGGPTDAETARVESLLAHDEARTLGIPFTRTGTPAPGDEQGTAAVCTRRGRKWQVSLGDRTVLVDHGVGMFHLAVLTSNPGEEIPALDLVTGLAALGKAAAPPALSSQPVLDRTAIREYRGELDRLREAVEELEEAGDGERADRARLERDWLLAQLAGSVGLGGRPRRFTDGAERARIAVGKAVRRAVLRISATDEVVGDHLRQSIHTGMRCSYRPWNRP